MSGSPPRQRDHLRPRGDRHQVTHRRGAHHPRAGREQAGVALRVARGSCRRRGAALLRRLARLSGQAQDAGRGRDAGRGSWPTVCPTRGAPAGNRASRLCRLPRPAHGLSHHLQGSGWLSPPGSSSGSCCTDHARLGRDRRCSAARRARLPRGPEQRGRGRSGPRSRSGSWRRGWRRSSAAMSPPARRGAKPGTDVAEGLLRGVVALVVLAAVLLAGLSLLVPPVALVAAIALAWLWFNPGARPSASTRACGSSARRRPVAKLVLAVVDAMHPRHAAEDDRFRRGAHVRGPGGRGKMVDDCVSSFLGRGRLLGDADRSRPRRPRRWG